MNKLYTGEYSLEQWIKLILKKNIVIPEYQRLFVWDKSRSKNLIESIENGYFVPPVTIGSYINPSNGKSRDLLNSDRKINLILDGQQRLTSIFLSYLDIFPNIEKFKKDQRKSRNQPYFEIDPETEDMFIEWRFDKLLELGSNKEEIREKAIDTGYYTPLETNLDSSFFRNHYLPFCYLVPDVKKLKDQRSYYSKVFRDINIQGIALNPIESRSALYHLDEEKKYFFNPDPAKEIVIKSDGKHVDYVRYLSFSSELNKINTNNDSISNFEVGSKYSGKFEEYYTDYIYHVINESESSRFIQEVPQDFMKKNDQIFSMINVLFSTYQKLSGIEKREGLQQFESIIEADIFFFGLVFYVIFQNVSIEDYIGRDHSEFVQKMSYEIEKNKYVDREDNEDDYKEIIRNPNTLYNLRKRITSSVRLYSEYFDLYEYLEH